MPGVIVLPGVHRTRYVECRVIDERKFCEVSGRDGPDMQVIGIGGLLWLAGIVVTAKVINARWYRGDGLGLLTFAFLWPVIAVLVYGAVGGVGD
jgi:hypothetical protein